VDGWAARSRMVSSFCAADPRHLQRRQIPDRRAVLWHPYLHGLIYSTTRDETRSATTRAVTTTRQ